MYLRFNWDFNLIEVCATQSWGINSSCSTCGTCCVTPVNSFTNFVLVKRKIYNLKDVIRFNTSFVFRFGLFGITASVPDKEVMNYVGVALCVCRWGIWFLLNLFVEPRLTSFFLSHWVILRYFIILSKFKTYSLQQWKVYRWIKQLKFGWLIDWLMFNTNFISI